MLARIPESGAEISEVVLRDAADYESGLCALLMCPLQPVVHLAQVAGYRVGVIPVFQPLLQIREGRDDRAAGAASLRFKQARAEIAIVVQIMVQHDACLVLVDTRDKLPL